MTRSLHVARTGGIAVLNIIAGLSGSSLAAAAPTSTPAGTPIAQTSRVTPVTRLAGWTVWSAADDGRYALTARTPDGKTVALPVPTRTVPFDADLGRDQHGKLVLAYSRCATEPTAVWAGSTQLPLRVTGRNCAIYTYRLGAAKEQRVRLISSRSGSEMFPSISGSRIAFVSVAPHQAGRAYRATVQVATLRSRPRVRQLRGGPVGVDGLPGPSGLDLHGKTVAVTWASRNSTAAGTGAFASESRLLVDTVGGRSRLIQRLTQGSESSLQLQAPTINGRYVYYSAVGYDRPNVLSRASLSTDRISSVPAPLYVTGLAADAGTLTLAVAPGDPTLGASKTCVGVHTATLVPGQTQDTTCALQTIPISTFR